MTGDAPRRIILDFEKAAIKAAREVFPTASVQGCGFHLAQAWNRSCIALGLKKYILGPERDDRIVGWWETIRGTPFLPRELIPRVRALQRPPVHSRHKAYKACQDFLNYLQATWLQGAFKDMWCKWNMAELRTTNLAEAFHRRLGVLIPVHHPPLSVLIDTLRKLNFETRATLRRLQEDPAHAKVLRKRDLERRAKIAEEMREWVFQALQAANCCALTDRP
ncbi:hypothetical protein COOONC_20114 [Cooperia oncophora]